MVLSQYGTRTSSLQAGWWPTRPVILISSTVAHPRNWTASDIDDVECQTGLSSSYAIDQRLRKDLLLQLCYIWTLWKRVLFIILGCIIHHLGAFSCTSGLYPFLRVEEETNAIFYNWGCECPRNSMCFLLSLLTTLLTTQPRFYRQYQLNAWKVLLCTLLISDSTSTEVAETERRIVHTTLVFFPFFNRIRCPCTHLMLYLWLP